MAAIRIELTTESSRRFYNAVYREPAMKFKRNSASPEQRSKSMSDTHIEVVPLKDLEMKGVPGVYSWDQWAERNSGRLAVDGFTVVEGSGGFDFPQDVLLGEDFYSFVAAGGYVEANGEMAGADPAAPPSRLEGLHLSGHAPEHATPPVDPT